MAKVTISSESDAIKLIQKALKNELGDNYEIVFNGWPKLTIVLEGEGYAGTITPSLMESLVELQNGLNRAYAKVVYNQADSRILKAIERQELEFKAKVEDNCTKIEIDFTDLLKKTIDVLGAKMEAKHVVILGIAGMSLWVADSAIKSHYEAETKIKTVQQDTIKSTALSKQETDRMKILAEAIKKEPQLAQIQKDAAETHVGLLKGVSDAESIEINGITFNKEDAKALSRNQRATATDIQLNGNYQILSVDTSLPEETKIKVKYIPDGREFNARFKDATLDANQIKILQESEWDRRKVYLSVNATELRGQITTATIISVTKQPKK